MFEQIRYKIVPQLKNNLERRVMGCRKAYLDGEVVIVVVAIQDVRHAFFVEALHGWHQVPQSVECTVGAGHLSNGPVPRNGPKKNFSENGVYYPV